jgi:hypothetical protein
MMHFSFCILSLFVSLFVCLYRIGIAPTENRSEGTGSEFYIQSIGNDGTITLSSSSSYNYNAEFIPPVQSNTKPALKSAEVVNLSRSIVITGDDFQHVPCENNLPEAVPGEQSSTEVKQPIQLFNNSFEISECS